MSTIKKLLVLTSGGDAPGMNAAVRAVVRAAAYYGIDAYAAWQGYEGLVKGDITLMSPQSVANCIQRGGTILRTGRFPAFKEKSTRDTARRVLAEAGIDGMVVIGGDGSFRGATLLEAEGGPRVIGIPATIDNDIIGSDYTLGFDTARNTALNAIDNIRDTASSHSRHFLVEVMGRNAGFLAVDVAIAGGAELVLIPEYAMSLDALVDAVRAPRRAKSSSIIVVAEADHPYRSIGIADDIKKASGIEYRVCVLGHVQRGGCPTALDRIAGSVMGAKAVDALIAGMSQQMLVEVRGEWGFAPFPDPELPSRRFADEAMLRVNEMLCA